MILRSCLLSFTLRIRHEENFLLARQDIDLFFTFRDLGYSCHASLFLDEVLTVTPLLFIFGPSKIGNWEPHEEDPTSHGKHRPAILSAQQHSCVAETRTLAARQMLYRLSGTDNALFAIASRRFLLSRWICIEMKSSALVPRGNRSLQRIYGYIPLYRYIRQNYIRGPI